MNNLILLFLIGSSSFIFSQDIIIKNNGEDLKVKVIEISENEVRYKSYQDKKDTLHIVLKSEILMIKYENGKVEVNDNGKESLSNFINSNHLINLKELGIRDAKRNYIKYKSAATGSFFAGLVCLFPIVPIVAGFVEPETSNLGITKMYLYNVPEYRLGYNQYALKVKKRKMYMNHWFGVTVHLSIIALLLFG
ncbi:MAG: hypothetical protein SFY32_12680 [Bacteroidota bacterium]|nr:hypothetical protein [Bacteroidota bacterium]